MKNPIQACALLVCLSLGYSTNLNAQNNMVTVQGGVLPQGSQLAGQTVSTFKIGKFEVTLEEWQSVREWAVANGYNDLENVGKGTAPDHPVREVSWYDVKKWCNAKSEMDGLEPVYFVNEDVYRTGEFGWDGSSAITIDGSANGYRLPSEKEWEWAARGGASSKGYIYSGSNDANAVAWTNENSSNDTKAVGTKASNELGIHDMSGNLMEWCEDSFHGSSDRRIRGGSWDYQVSSAAVADRVNHIGVAHRVGFIGLRVARSFY